MKVPEHRGEPPEQPSAKRRSGSSLGVSSRRFGNSRLGVPMEWIGGSNWRLPSGKALAEFALQAGFLAPLLLGPGVPGAPSGNNATPGSGIRRRRGADIPLPLPGEDTPNDLKTVTLPPRGSR
jgi:hypothetical protein